MIAEIASNVFYDAVSILEALKVIINGFIILLMASIHCFDTVVYGDVGVPLRFVCE